MKRGLPGGALGVIVEPEFENVFEVLGVARDCHETLFLGEEGKCTDAGLVSAATRAEIVGYPIVHAVGVLD